MADADPELRLHTSVVIAPPYPCEVVVEGDLMSETKIRRDEIVSKVRDGLHGLIASVAEDAAIELYGVSSVNLKNDVLLQKVLKTNKVTYYNYPAKHSVTGEAVMVILSYFKGNERGRDEVKKLLLKIKTASHVAVPNHSVEDWDDCVEPILSLIDHDTFSELARSFVNRPLGHLLYPYT